VCTSNSIPPPAPRGAPHRSPHPRTAIAPTPSAAKARREELFRRGLAIEVIAAELGRAPSTVWSYLAEFVRSARPASIRPWISAADEERVTAQLHLAEGGRMKPVFDALGGARRLRQHPHHRRVCSRPEWAGTEWAGS
jgi:hypothetical protein